MRIEINEVTIFLFICWNLLTVFHSWINELQYTVKIFAAIQKCDPAPFYLFDEVDAPLDEDHRMAVARTIHTGLLEVSYCIYTFLC